MCKLLEMAPMPKNMQLSKLSVTRTTLLMDLSQLFMPIFLSRGLLFVIRHQKMQMQ